MSRKWTDPVDGVIGAFWNAETKLDICLLINDIDLYIQVLILSIIDVGRFTFEKSIPVIFIITTYNRKQIVLLQKQMLINATQVFTIKVAILEQNLFFFLLKNNNFVFSFREFYYEIVQVDIFNMFKHES